MNKRTFAAILLIAATLTGCSSQKPEWLDVVNHNLTSTGYPATTAEVAAQVLDNICAQRDEGMLAADIFHSDQHTPAETDAVLVMVEWAIEHECA